MTFFKYFFNINAHVIIIALTPAEFSNTAFGNTHEKYSASLF